MSAQVEVANLVARLTGDGSGYQAMLQEAMSATSDMGEEISRAENAMLTAQTAVDQLAAVHDELAEAVKNGTVSTEEMTAIMETAGQQVTQVYSEIAEEERRYNEVMREGEATTKALMNAEERHAQELERLSKLLQQGAISHETFTRGVIQAQKQLEAATPAVANFGQNLSMAGTAIVGFGAAVTAAFGMLGRSAMANWEEAESTAFRLEAAIEANGGAVEETMAKYRQFASELQNVTTIGDDTTLALLQEAESYGLTGAAAERAAKNAIALAAAKNMSASSTIRMTVALEQGRSEMLGRFLPALRGIKDEAERTAKAHELIGNMMGVAEADAKSFGGQIKQLNNAWGDFLEEIGRVLATVLKPFIAILKEMVYAFQQSSTTAKYTAAAIILVGTALGAVATATGGVILATGGLVIAYQALVGAFAQGTAAAGAFGAALNIALGPVGLIAVAATAAAGAILYMSGVRAEASAKALAAQELEVAKGYEKVEQLRREIDLKRISEGIDPKFFKTEDLLKDQTPQELLTKVEELTKEYEKQAQAIGKTSRQAEIDFLRRSGVHDKFLQDLIRLDKQLTSLEETEKAKKKAEEERNQTMEEAKRIVEASLTPYQKYQQELEKIHKLGEGGFLKPHEVSQALAHAKEQFEKISVTEDQKKAEALTKSLQTPLQKFKEKALELQQYRLDKLIDEGTFQRGLDEATKEYKELTKDKEVKIKLRFEGIDAVASGSLDALSRIAEFHSLKGGKAELGAMELAEQAGVNLKGIEEQDAIGVASIRSSRDQRRKDVGGVASIRQAREERGEPTLERIAKGIADLVSIGKKTTEKETVTLVKADL